MKDEMGKVCGTRRLAPNAGGLVGVASGRLSASAGDSKKTEYNGWKRRKRSCISPSHRARELRTRCVFRNIPFPPFPSVKGGNYAQWNCVCPAVPQTPVCGGFTTHGQCEAVEAFARPPSPRLRRDKQGLFPAGSKAAPVEVSGRKPTGRGATEPRRKAPIQRRRQYPKFFSVCFAGSKPCAADLRNQCSAFSRFFGTPPPL